MSSHEKYYGDKIIARVEMTPGLLEPRKGGSIDWNATLRDEIQNYMSQHVGKKITQETADGLRQMITNFLERHGLLFDGQLGQSFDVYVDLERGPVLMSIESGILVCEGKNE